MKPANGRRLEWLGHANISTTRIDDQPPHAAGGQPYVQGRLLIRHAEFQPLFLKPRIHCSLQGPW
jgi:ABC-type phosphonate transport system ATPase subunit